LDAHIRIRVLFFASLPISGSSIYDFSFIWFQTTHTRPEQLRLSAVYGSSIGAVSPIRLVLPLGLGASSQFGGTIPTTWSAVSGTSL
jgi:hypothetical protein